MSSPARAADELTVDLSDQFPSECRSQDDVGACHTFAAVALLEAAIKRRGKEAVELSDADLFVQGTIGQNGLRPLMMKMRSFSGDKEWLAVDYLDGGWPYEDLKYALFYGVAEREAFGWSDFLEAYNGYRKSYAAQCKQAFKEDADEKAAKDRQADGVAGEPAVVNGCTAAGPKLKDFVELLAKPEVREQIARGLSAAGHDLAKSRAKTSTSLHGLKVDQKTFEGLESPAADDKGKCREKGAAQRQAILARFSAMRPVAVCFKMKGFKAWGDHDGSHCVVLTGYVRDEGRYRFTTRNSWIVVGPTKNPVKRIFMRAEGQTVNPDFQEDELCRVSEVVWVEP